MLTHLNTFSVPPRESLEYGGTALTYADGSLFMVGNPEPQRVHEILIPEFTWGEWREVSPFDPTQGQRLNIGVNHAPIDTSGVLIGGLLVTPKEIIGSLYGYYDPDGLQHYTHFGTNPLRFWRVGRPGFVAGYMGNIPEKWKKPFGASYVTGQAAIPIISRTSLGPALSTFLNGAPKQILGYPITHPTLGDYEHTVCIPDGFNMATTVTGVVWVGDIIYFFGTQALGPPRYGKGTPWKELDGKPTGDGEVYCYDPANFDKGPHGFPYTAFTWMYLAEELLLVRQGKEKMWEPTPFATERLPFSNVAGAAFDGEKIYLSEKCGDGVLPLIHVMGVN